DIPEHWKISKLKRLLIDKLKYGANEAAILDDRELPRYIRITDFDDSGSLRDDTFKSLPFELAEEYLLKEGDVLFARSGATVGKTFIFKGFNGKACFAGYLIRARTNVNILLPEFLNYYTKSPIYLKWKNNIFTQSTIQNIGADKYQYLPIPLPPLTEQKAIANYLDSLREKTESTINVLKEQIQVLKDYKKSLIHECVTGKRKVVDA
ncbi:MAG: restriction endonuclease subunit S, partial [Leptospiraceae bacterium]|nr:restriction endonuclease subunit S [Leptospiraceae bacterium]